MSAPTVAEMERAVRDRAVAIDRMVPKTKIGGLSWTVGQRVDLDGRPFVVSYLHEGKGRITLVPYVPTVGAP